MSDFLSESSTPRGFGGISARCGSHVGFLGGGMLDTLRRITRLPDGILPGLRRGPTANLNLKFPLRICGSQRKALPPRPARARLGPAMKETKITNEAESRRAEAIYG